MTSPAINGQKENGKSESTSAAAAAGAEETTSRQQDPVPETVRSNSPLTAWWRIFKLANLLMQQGC